MEVAISDKNRKRRLAGTMVLRVVFEEGEDAHCMQKSKPCSLCGSHHVFYWKHSENTWGHVENRMKRAISQFSRIDMQ